jgi:hypothetical protein
MKKGADTMLVSEVKRIGKVGKNLLENKNAEEIIEIIIEKPLQKACKECKQKNIETVMSSANKKNVVKDDKKILHKKDVVEKIKQHKMQNFMQAGKGYAWLMLNYNTLSNKNKEIIFSLEEKLGEEVIWFVKENFTDSMNVIRKHLRIKPIVQKFDDKYADRFKDKQLLLMYNNKYPTRNVFIRMPIDENTKVEEVEEYFSNIIAKLIKQ